MKHIYPTSTRTTLSDSISMALIEIIDNIYNDLEKEKYVAGIYLDMSMAYDIIDHNIILDKLNFYDIRGIGLKAT